MFYDFATQLAIGKVFEARLDKHFERNYRVGQHPNHDIQMILEKAGIDRIFRQAFRIPGHETQWTTVHTVEYKADCQGHRTGNVFLEIEIIQKNGTRKPGWAPKIIAQELIYFFTESQEILICNPLQMKTWLSYWSANCQWRNCRNDGYEARGVLVPRYCTANVMGFEKACVDRIEILMDGIGQRNERI